MEVGQQGIFENAGQAVHVAFLVMAQEATQDAPLRKALIRAMESVQLGPGQRHWLDQLRGTGGGTVNFEGLSGDEIRAQCALITQAVKTKLPNVEMWVLQAKYGQTDFEDVVEGAPAVKLIDNGPAPWDARSCRQDKGEVEQPQARRRFAFSPERIEAIKGLSDWFAPMFPRIKPLAIDLMLGRMFANHRKIDISVRDLAGQFGGSHMIYFRASCKMKNHIRKLEEMAVARLEPIFQAQGVTTPLQDFLS